MFESWKEREFEKKMERFRTALQEKNTILIGAGAGLSTSAGFTYSGERFRKYFADFEQKYGFHDMYSGGFYPYDTLEEYWAYWSRYIYINRYQDAPKPVYQKLSRAARKSMTMKKSFERCCLPRGIRSWKTEALFRRRTET